jgi:hypothetical protein
MHPLIASLPQLSLHPPPPYTRQGHEQHYLVNVREGTDAVVLVALAIYLALAIGQLQCQHLAEKARYGVCVVSGHVFGAVADVAVGRGPFFAGRQRAGVVQKW